MQTNGVKGHQHLDCFADENMFTVAGFSVESA